MLIPPRFAHEVYVLTPEQINHDLGLHSPNVWRSLNNSHNLRLFILFSLLMLGILGIALFLKATKPAQRLGRFLNRATIIAPDLIRVAFGVSLLISASNNTVFGPELPISNFPLPYLLRASLIVIGAALIIGMFTRLFAWLAVVMFFYVLAANGWYMFTYLNYLGEALAIALLPTQMLSLDAFIAKLRHIKPIKPRYESYSMPVARVLFGFSIIYAAVNVKFVTSALSINVVNQYHLTNYFPVDPLLLVLAAGLIECLIGFMYMLGLLQRFNTVFFLIFLALSLAFFKEDVWPHYLLIALAIGIFLHKPDNWALDGRLFSKQKSRHLPNKAGT